MLVLDIEFLMGVSFAAVEKTLPLADFPPQPDRVFSALVASWAARGKRDDERQALEWLESQAPPSIASSGWRQRTAVTHYVPPNDPRTRGNDPAKIRQVLPDYRKRQPRTFPAAIPAEPCVSYTWPESSPDEAILGALAAIAHDTSYVGHSASLVRLAFRRASEVPAINLQASRRRIYPGRVRELEAVYERGHRPRPGDPMRRETSSEPRAMAHGPFGSDWLVLERIGGAEIDLRAAPVVARKLRDAVMSGYDQTGNKDAIPEVVSGHKTDGSPSAAAHLAIVPMAFVGHEHADGRLFGFALVPPHGSGLLEHEEFRAALHTIAAFDPGEERRVIDLRLGTDAPDYRLGFVRPGESRTSLRPDPYCRTARKWGTVAPIVLDRHLKTPTRSRTRGDNAALQAEIEDIVATACEHVGLPRPARVVAAKHSAFPGAPPARPSGNAPQWTAWSMPESLKSRALTHAVITFDQPVEGPLLLGAGRYVGLGLCLPVDGSQG